MSEAHEVAADDVVSLQIIHGVLVAAPHGDMTKDRLAVFEGALSTRIAETSVRRVVIDLSRIAIVDTNEFEQLRKIAKVASVMGARTILCGLRPGPVTALVYMGARLGGTEAAQNVDDALKAYRQKGLGQAGRRKCSRNRK